jgi:hypothetical protein
VTWSIPLLYLSVYVVGHRGRKNAHATHVSTNGDTLEGGASGGALSGHDATFELTSRSRGGSYHEREYGGGGSGSESRRETSDSRLEGLKKL